MRSTPIACIAALAAVALPAQTASAHHPGDDHAPRSGKIAPQTRELLGQVRKATRRYRDVAVAKAAGYEAAKTCAEDPKYGGMGIHYANPKLLADGVLDPTRPEVLVYQPARDGRLSLGAVEYFLPDADQDLDTNEDQPSLFGLPFDGPMLGHEPGMPKHYDLHVWLYKHNPAGLFAAWNPTVRCP
jgi:hypothetical protein